MSTIEKAVREAIPARAVAVQNGLPVIVAGTEPHIPTEAEMYAAHRQYVVECAVEVIAACDDLQTTETRVRMKWWQTLQRMAAVVTPGNGKQFSREFDAVRQQILDDLAARAEDKGRFVPSGKAESLAAKWKELEQARSGFSTFANYASQTRSWIETVKASVDPKQSPESFGMTVRNFYADHKAAEKAKASGKGATAPKGKGEGDEAPVVPTGEVAEDGTPLMLTVGAGKANIRVKGASGNFETVEVRFPTEVIGALARLTKQIGYAVHEKMPPAEIVAALGVAHDMLGPKLPAKRK